jgi:uncharacterized protein YebE (UPF0316 family)
MDPQIFGMIYIFFARICDVSLGTMRIILIARGYRYIAPVLGFFEILIWLTAISKALQNLNSIYSYLIYAAGFAAGNYIGMLIEAKLSIGYQTLRIITSEKVSALSMTLCEEGFGITTVKGRGIKGEVDVLFTVVHKRDVKRLVEIVHMIEPNAFITIEDVRSHIGGFLGKKDFFTLFGRMVLKKK